MKKLTFLLGIVLVFAINSGFAQKSSSFKKIGKLYEQQTKTFFAEVFDSSLTGTEMAKAARAEMEDMIHQCFLNDFSLWAKFSKKYQGDKKFVLTLSRTKEYEAESNEYMNQFKKIQDEFVDNRLKWEKDELSKVLTKERLQKYIDPVVKKFEIRTTDLLAKLKSTYTVKKKKR